MPEVSCWHDSPLGMILAGRLVRDASNTVLGSNQLDHRQVSVLCFLNKIHPWWTVVNKYIARVPLGAFKIALQGKLTSPYIDFV
jgi:hypothetical protein